MQSKAILLKETPKKGKHTKKVTNHEELLRLFTSSLRRPLGANETVPLCEVIKYGYWDRVVLQGAAPFLVREYNINDVWQTFPGGPTGTMSGYNSSAFRYALFKVISSIIRCTFTSNENFGMSFYFITSDTQMSTLITSYALALKYGRSSNVLFSNSVGYSSGDSRYISRPHKIFHASLVGSPMAYYSDGIYGGSLGTPLIAVPIPGASPTTGKTWGAFVLLSDGPAQNLTNGGFLDYQSSNRTLNHSVRIDA